MGREWSVASDDLPKRHSSGVCAVRVKPGDPVRNQTSPRRYRSQEHALLGVIYHHGQCMAEWYLRNSTVGVLLREQAKVLDGTSPKRLC